MDERHEAATRHTPVMLDRCVELLAPALSRPGALAIDGTLGMGGHSEAILERCPEARVVGIDRDPQAIALASARLARFGDRFVAHHSEYDDVEGALEAAGAEIADGVLLDLGVSSLQIDDAERGFSYAQDAPLDMRMNPGDPVTAADILRDADERELTRILRDYGEERFALKIARSIVRRRESEPFERSSQLVDVVRASIPAAQRVHGGNPAKRTFQALRIAVNRELEVLEDAIRAAIEGVAVGGRVVVMSYHSLEDRIVKHAFAAGAESTAPPGLPIVPDADQPYLALLTRGAEKASVEEAEANPRSKPVRLRAVERIRPTPPERLRRIA
ncbi:16S rRNA (cytosine(1402)-N(4))-methyltransferase RsmH [Demequina sp. SYSU T00039]|uniref:Ribosomal RNA small subunit methyltransferase H n=1 Tax=Demequina lignilytica TaxID=3051663 RepID=A0AAW7M7U1_9MICO|nr:MULTISPECIES: 16S rRNA (cytosine(1402)-N(4))-methyltransferase RsmH [unclassified Demequina]MDN4477122.1 16S rRNA (cytosine(1402)-N(4))-methyltransferase RsmH [Demequina sp. SYSU T00039-1]MDN4487295.1 16S rRNA (cytosine(1402)-N(4))-methyltransferase RsmH [Demequina sp. SYSU T00039]MDN4491546.1 16S rRNA (cytosine(1402)-N(4))-methyltransferase RsmH [Demequina sp. SYSU T00068]